jgi:hypothetical protein
MFFPKRHIITYKVAKELIDEYKLKIYKNIWHYSFNRNFLDKDFYIVKDKYGNINLYSEALNQYSPLLLFVNDNGKNIIRYNKTTNNSILDGYDFLNKEKRNIFWYLRTTTFDEFLDQKTKRSKSADAHYPSSKTYYKFMEKYDMKLLIDPLEDRFFIKNYNNLKRPEHLSGEEVLRLLKQNNPGIPQNWLKTATLLHDNLIVGIASLIEDGRCVFADNVASKLSKLSYGICLFTETIKYCCKHGYESFDGGISGYYGGYKYKIWLDSFEVYQYTEPFLKRNLKWYGKILWRKNDD